MKFKILIFACVLLALSSCQKEESDIPSIPDDVFIDVDNNGVMDFLIKYYDAIINSPTSTKGRICEIEILGENQLLLKEDAPLLFLTNTNEIKKDVIAPLSWKNIDAHIATFENHFGSWPSSWEVASDDTRDSYIIGVKLKGLHSINIGWIEFEIDNKSGHVNILERKIL